MDRPRGCGSLPKHCHTACTFPADRTSGPPAPEISDSPVPAPTMCGSSIVTTRGIRPILRRLHGEIVATRADLAICQADLVAESGDLLRHLDRVPRGGVIGTAELADRILTGTVNGYLANKLFRRALLSPAGFPSMSLQEDIVGIISILPTIGRTVLIAETLFFHIAHAGSLTTLRNPDLQNLRQVRGCDGRTPSLELGIAAGFAARQVLSHQAHPVLDLQHRVSAVHPGRGDRCGAGNRPTGDNADGRHCRCPLQHS